ncbi:MAG: formate dehydrogenase [Burkholderiales bacterium]|nr:formate dehydrogenase [Burkholderiales bacterium]
MSTSSQRAGQSPHTDLKRRRFLLALGAGSAGAATAAAQPLAGVTDSADATQTSQGYRETEHVRDYYASARL